MKKFAILAVVSALAFACAQEAEKSVAQLSLETEILSLTSPEAQVKISLFEKTDSTTFRQELEYRRGQFETKLSQDKKFLDEYVGKNMQVNAAKKQAAVKNDERVLAEFDKLAEGLAERLDEVAYYDYIFSGKAVTEDAETVFDKYYASITPDGEVLSIESSTKGLHKALGRVIPGYAELIKNEE